MATDDPEDAYAQFMFSEHQTATTLPDSATSGTPTPAPASNSKYEYDIRDNEKSRILRLIVRLLLHRAPFVTRYDEIRAVVKTYLHDHANHAIVNCFIGEYHASLQFQYGIEDAKKLVSKTLGLILCDIKLQGARREFFLKQSLAFQPHDLKLLGDGDHELRGFLLLLLPCFKAYTTGIPLGSWARSCRQQFSDRLCEVFTRVGKADMVPRDQASEEALKAALRGARRKRAVKYSASEFNNIADYLLYAKELGYLSLVTDPKKGDTLAVITVVPGYRLLFELDQESYVKQLSTLELDEGLKRTLEAFFDR